MFKWFCFCKWFCKQIYSNLFFNNGFKLLKNIKRTLVIENGYIWWVLDPVIWEFQNILKGPLRAVWKPENLPRWLMSMAPTTLDGKSIRSSNLIHPKLTGVQGSHGRVSGNPFTLRPRDSVKSAYIKGYLSTDTHTDTSTCSHWQRHNLLLRLIFDMRWEWKSGCTTVRMLDVAKHSAPAFNNCCRLLGVGHINLCSPPPFLPPLS